MRKITKRILAVAFSAMLSISMAVSAYADEKVIKLAFTDSPTLTIGDMTIYHPSYAAMLAFKGAFEKSTGNEYKVELYANGVLGDAASTLEQVLAGTITGTTPADGTFSAFAPDIQVFSIPYLFPDTTTAYEVLDGEFVQNLYEKVANETGFRIIAAYDNGGYRNFTNSKHEIKSAADMAGLNIRVMDSPVYMKMIDALGAKATPVAFLELYSALQTGVVDGQENSSVTTLGASLNEVQPYCTLDGHLLGLAFLTISDEWYKSLDADTQAKVIEAGKEATIAARGTCRYAEALANQTMAEKGVQVYSPTAEEMETFKVAQEPVVEYLKTELDPTLVDGLLQSVTDVENGVTQTATTNTDGAATQTTQTTSASEFNYGMLIGIAVVIILLVAFFMQKKKKEVQK